MRGEDVAKAITYIDDQYLELAETEKKKRGQASARVALFRGIAACLACAVGVLTIIALNNKSLASEWFGLRRLLIRQERKAEDVTNVELTEGEGEAIAAGVSSEQNPFVENVTLISLSGYLDSPEASAAGEWQEFLEHYDEDGTILAAADKTWAAPEGYEEYFVYSDDMVAQLDKITQKHGLKKHQGFRELWRAELVDLVGGDFMGPRCADDVCGYGYADGTFQFDADYLATGGRKYGYQFRRCMKGYFDEVLLNIGDLNDYEEWQYETKDGEQVMLALSAYKGLIYGDFDDCFILINLLDGTGNGVTKEDLELLADTHDLGMLKKER